MMLSWECIMTSFNTFKNLLNMMINITLGLPFTRISPDHGPNEKMIGKNTSNPLSLVKALQFLDKN